MTIPEASQVIDCLACLANAVRLGPCHVVTTGEAITHGAWLTATRNLLAMCDFTKDWLIPFNTKYINPFMCVALTPEGEKILVISKTRWMSENRG